MKRATRERILKTVVVSVFAIATIMSVVCATTTRAAEVEAKSSVMHFNSIDDAIKSWENRAANMSFDNGSFNFTFDANEYDEVKQFETYYENKVEQLEASNCYSLNDYYLYFTATNVSTSANLNDDGETYTGKCDFSFKTDVHGSISDFIAARNAAASIASQWAGLDDYNKVISIVEWICNNTKYDYAGAAQNADSGHSLGSCIFDHICVCDANAQAFQAMAEAIGLRSVIMNGEARGEGHAWNAVCINGSWYIVDSTVANQPNSIDYRRVLFGTESTRVAANEYEYVTTLPLSATDYPIKTID